MITNMKCFMLIEMYKVIGNICSHRLGLVAIGYECAMLP